MRNQIIRSTVTKDAVVIFSITVVFYVLFSQFDVLERIVTFVSKHEDIELDELISTSIIFSLCMATYGIRWWRQSVRINQLLKAQKEELQQAISEIKVLRGIIPICSYCKRIRDDDDSWEQMEAYIDSHSEAQFSHGLCPECREIPMRELKEILKNQSH